MEEFKGTKESASMFDPIEKELSKLKFNSGLLKEYNRRKISDLEARLKEAVELVEKMKNDFQNSNWTEDTYKKIDSFLAKEKTK